jgi:GNAT superfamily N-acetyltransferase
LYNSQDNTAKKSVVPDYNSVFPKPIKNPESFEYIVIKSYTIEQDRDLFKQIVTYLDFFRSGIQDLVFKSLSSKQILELYPHFNDQWLKVFLKRHVEAIICFGEDELRELNGMPKSKTIKGLVFFEFIKNLNLIRASGLSVSPVHWGGVVAPNLILRLQEEAHQKRVKLEMYVPSLLSQNYNSLDDNIKPFYQRLGFKIRKFVKRPELILMEDNLANLQRNSSNKNVQILLEYNPTNKDYLSSFKKSIVFNRFKYKEIDLELLEERSILKDNLIILFKAVDLTLALEGFTDWKKQKREEIIFNRIESKAIIAFDTDSSDLTINEDISIPVGIATYSLETSTLIDSNEKVILCSNLIVSPAHRRNGIGGELITRLKNIAIETSVPIEITVDKKSDELNSYFLYGNGFRRSYK